MKQLILVPFELLLCAFLSPGCAPLFAEEAGKFHDIEAAYIYQFTTYIEWTDRKPAHNTAVEPFVISILGRSPVIDRLQTLAKTKTVKGRPVEVHVDPDPAHLKKSQIVVLTKPDAGALQDLLAKTADTGTLVIAHGEGLGKAGATINFFIEDGRMRFEINRAMAEKQKLQISSQLLKLARLVE